MALQAAAVKEARNTGNAPDLAPVLRRLDDAEYARRQGFRDVVINKQLRLEKDTDTVSCGPLPYDMSWRSNSFFRAAAQNMSINFNRRLTVG